MPRKATAVEQERPSFVEALRGLADAKGLSDEEVLHALEEATERAYVKELGGGDDAVVSCHIDPQTGKVTLAQIKDVVDEVEDDYLQISVEDANEGLAEPKYKAGDKFAIYEDIADASKVMAKAVKNNFRQKLGEAERTALYKIYKDHIGEMMVGTVEKSDDKMTTILIGRTPIDMSRHDLIGDEYLPAWQKFGLFDLKCQNTEETVRAYSMANYPAEGDRIMLTVRIATPPFKPKPAVGFQDVMPGIASSYIFTLKPGDKVTMSGPYGDFHPIFNSKKEMIWVGGGAGMAPLRAQIMHMTKTLHTTDRKMSYFYGARALNEVFYLQDFLELEKEFPNFKFHLALDRPDPAADAAGVKYTAGFVHQVMYETYLKDHDAPEDIEYYMCGPGPMSAAVVRMLTDLGVEEESILYDNFGG